MRAINTGNTYEIFDDSLQTFDKLPTQTYVVRFNKNKGFFLEKYVDIEIKEEKVYGVHLEKVNKVLNSFEKFNRNLGVILSGDKGIGKSLFAKLLAIEAMNKNIPLIVVDTFIPGIASYIESIEQEVMVLFDEFDKTFGEVRQNDGEASPQAHLLSLFDGVSGGKKLFVVTCNELRKLNDYLILNYDCLRAIAFEISSGIKFKDAIKDLNIINMESERYNITLHFNNGMTATAKSVYLDLFGSGTDETIYLCDKSGKNYVDVTFNTMNCQFDSKRLMNVVLPEDLYVSFDDDDEYKDLVSQAKEAQIECLTIGRCRDRNIHYLI